MMCTYEVTNSKQAKKWVMPIHHISFLSLIAECDTFFWFEIMDMIWCDRIDLVLGYILYDLYIFASTLSAAARTEP